MTMTSLQLYIYFASALAGVVFHWVTTAKADKDRPSGVQWLMRHYGYAFGSLGLTLASALVLMPTTMGLEANVTAIAFGISGGSAIKNLFVRTA